MNFLQLERLEYVVMKVLILASVRRELFSSAQNTESRILPVLSFIASTHCFIVAASLALFKKQCTYEFTAEKTSQNHSQISLDIKKHRNHHLDAQSFLVVLMK